MVLGNIIVISMRWGDPGDLSLDPFIVVWRLSSVLVRLHPTLVGDFDLLGGAGAGAINFVHGGGKVDNGGLETSYCGC
jgi:hypothetical protein